MSSGHMLVVEDKHMTVYRANVKIKINGSATSTWVEIEAVNANTALALLQAQYGKEYVINVIRKSGQ
jgi:hypothetical protein